MELHYKFALIVTLSLLNCINTSLLQTTLAGKGNGISENDEETNVEVVSEEKKYKENGQDLKETDENKETAHDKTHNEIILETIYKPKICKNKTAVGKVAVLHYTGSIHDEIFDSTIDPLKKYTPFEFIIGTGAVIKGFEKGIKSMCKGEQRKIIIPPELGYGEKGTGLIPGKLT